MGCVIISRTGDRRRVVKERGTGGSGNDTDESGRNRVECGISQEACRGQLQ